MFIGEYSHSIDAKGRLILPSRFREDIGEKCIVAKGYDGCLNIYTNDEWQSFVDGLTKLSPHNPDARRVLRMFASGATACEPDKQGRILLPAHLREYAKNEKEVMVIGAITRVEIWDGEAWEKYNNDEDALTLEEAAARLSEMGI